MTRLEKVTHLAIIAICCLSAVLLIEHRLRMTPASSSRSDIEAKLVGSKLKLPGVDWSANRATMVLQISSTCIYCQKEVPFYKKLASTQKDRANAFALLVVTGDDDQIMRSFLNESGLTVDQVLSIMPSQTGTSATPVIFSVDAKGIVRRAFVGALDAEGEKEVLSLALGADTTHCAESFGAGSHHTNSEELSSICWSRS